MCDSATTIVVSGTLHKIQLPPDVQHVRKCCKDFKLKEKTQKGTGAGFFLEIRSGNPSDPHQPMIARTLVLSCTWREDHSWV